MEPSSEDRLYERAMTILDGGGVGMGEPILWHLALRRHADAMLALAARLGRQGKTADAFSPDGLEYRAYRLGAEQAGQHIAMTRFNRNDLQGYRLWLRRATRGGDRDAALELRLFETRLPHSAARRIKRCRPYRPSDGWWRANRQASKPTKYHPPNPFHSRSEQ